MTPHLAYDREHYRAALERVALASEDLSLDEAFPRRVDIDGEWESPMATAAEFLALAYQFVRMPADGTEPDRASSRARFLLAGLDLPDDAIREVLRAYQRAHAAQLGAGHEAACFLARGLFAAGRDALASGLREEAARLWGGHSVFPSTAAAAVCLADWVALSGTLKLSVRHHCLDATAARALQFGVQNSLGSACCTRILDMAIAAHDRADVLMLLTTVAKEEARIPGSAMQAWRALASQHSEKALGACVALLGAFGLHLEPTGSFTVMIPNKP